MSYLSEEELPRLWILSPSCSPRLLNGLGATLDLENWVEGVYFLPEVFKTALVAINQLPQIEATLWLRLLGRGETQRLAAREVQLLPIDHPLREDILEIVTRWYISLEISENITEEDREAIMNLTEIFEQRVEARLQERVGAAVQERQQMMVENLLRVRFGALDEDLERAIAPMLLLPVEELSRLLLTLSREDLVERFGGE